MSRIRTSEAVMRQAVGFLEEEAREYFDASNDKSNPDRAYCLARSKRMFTCAAVLKFVSEHGEPPMGRDKSRAVAQMLRHHGVLPKLPPKDRRWEKELAEYEASLSAPEARDSAQNATALQMTTASAQSATDSQTEPALGPVRSKRP